jgi:hypothetical protein
VAGVVHDLQQCTVRNSDHFIHLDIRGRKGVEGGRCRSECRHRGHGWDQFGGRFFGAHVLSIFEFCLERISLPQPKVEGGTTENKQRDGILERFSHHMGDFHINTILSQCGFATADPSGSVVSLGTVLSLRLM